MLISFLPWEASNLRSIPVDDSDQALPQMFSMFPRTQGNFTHVFYRISLNFARNILHTQEYLVLKIHSCCVYLVYFSEFHADGFSHVWDIQMSPHVLYHRLLVCSHDKISSGIAAISYLHYEFFCQYQRRHCMRNFLYAFVTCHWFIGSRTVSLYTETEWNELNLSPIL